LDSKYVVAEIEAVESFGGEKPEDGTWKPVRAKLGIEAFGVNAFVGREVGARVIEDHTEEGSGHQELYVVLAGRARFELDDEKVETKAGSLVFVADPTVKRTAFALEPNTSVLAIGAPAGSVFTPSSWDNPFTS
jgi:quercetin dioxygenase-like cupin family protein